MGKTLHKAVLRRGVLEVEVERGEDEGEFGARLSFHVTPSGEERAAIHAGDAMALVALSLLDKLEKLSAR
jgi:hypothetical protein